MDKEKMVLYLGYAALALIGIYFTFGILKISGEGLAKLGYPNNFIQEGFSDKEEKKIEKNVEKKLKEVEREAKGLDNLKEWVNNVNDVPGYGELVEGMKNQMDTIVRYYMANAVLSKNNNEFDNYMKVVDVYKKKYDYLNDYTI